MFNQQRRPKTQNQPNIQRTRIPFNSRTQPNSSTLVIGQQLPALRRPRHRPRGRGSSRRGHRAAAPPSSVRGCSKREGEHRQAIEQSYPSPAYNRWTDAIPRCMANTCPAREKPVVCKCSASRASFGRWRSHLRAQSGKPRKVHEVPRPAREQTARYLGLRRETRQRSGRDGAA